MVTKKELTTKLGRQFLVPKRMRIPTIKELVKMKLLKEESKDNFKILDYELNIEEDANKFLKMLNFFSIL